MSNAFNIFHRPRLTSIVTLITAVTLLGGCQSDLSDLQAYAEQVHARPAQPVAPPPAIPLLPRTVYSGAEQRDPFAPPQVAGKRDPVLNPGPPPVPANREELEQYALDSLRMVGTFELNGEHYGLVRSPGGTIHRVRVGNYMGQHYGKVVELSEVRIRLVEIIPGAAGWAERDAELALQL